MTQPYVVRDGNQSRAANGSHRITISGVDYTDALNSLNFFIVNDGEGIKNGHIVAIVDQINSLSVVDL